MKAASFQSIGKLEIQDKPIPKLEYGDVLIDVDLCGICISDLMALSGEVTDYTPPVVMGHEIAGKVTESRNDNVKVGTKVGVNPMISCGECYYCRRDLDKYCSNIYGIGHDIDGGYADYIRVPKHAIDTGKLIIVPDHVTSEELIFLEPLACCINAMRDFVFVAKPELRRKHRTDFKESVAILGAGTIGLIFLQLTKNKGLCTFTIEPLAHRREIAKEFGADYVADLDDAQIDAAIDEMDGGADTVIVATNEKNAIDLGFRVAKRGGVINFFGLFPKGNELRIELEELHFMGYKITASWAFSRWSFSEARKVVIAKELILKSLLTHRFSIDDAQKAFENARNRTGIKTALIGNSC